MAKDADYKIAAQIQVAVAAYYKKRGLGDKEFDVHAYRPNQYRKQFTVVSHVSHYADLPASAEGNLETYLNRLFKIPRYRISVIQDTTSQHQNFHIRLVRR